MDEIDEDCIVGKEEIRIHQVLAIRKFHEEHHEHWKTYNAGVLFWIINTILPHLLSGIVYASNAFLVWEDLKEIFDEVNHMKIYQLHREINTIVQETNFVSEYFTKLKELWSKFDAMVLSPD